MVMEDQNWRAQMSKAEIPASPLLGEEKLDSLIVATFKGTEEQREILAILK